MRGVTKMIRFFFSVWLDSLRNSLPRKGMSPSTGTLSLCFFTSSVSKPPNTTVCPSQTLQLVTTCRERKIGRGNCDVTGALGVLPLLMMIVGMNNVAVAVWYAGNQVICGVMVMRFE